MKKTFAWLLCLLLLCASLPVCAGAATARLSDGTTLTCTGFQKENATYDTAGKIIITFDLTLNGKTRNLRVSVEIPKVRSALPTDISVSADEWEVLRLTTTEPYWPELEIRINFDSPDDVYGFGGFGEDLKMMCQVLKSAARKEQVIL